MCRRLTGCSSQTRKGQQPRPTHTTAARRPPPANQCLLDRSTQQHLTSLYQTHTHAPTVSGTPLPLTPSPRPLWVMRGHLRPSNQLARASGRHVSLASGRPPCQPRAPLAPPQTRIPLVRTAAGQPHATADPTLRPPYRLPQLSPRRRRRMPTAHTAAPGLTWTPLRSGSSPRSWP